MDSSIINGVRIWSVKSKQELIDFALESEKILIAINAEKILHATEETRDLINRNIGYPDGIGAVWALKRKKHIDVVKIPGCELWLDLIRASYSTKSFYLIGSKQDVIENTVAKLRIEFPDIRIANYRNGYITTDQERNELISDIVAKKPDVVFLGMGSPKQELLMNDMQQKHKAVYQGLGGSFDVYTGSVQRAPAWWINNNLEWAYRLVKQPARIKRQIYLVKFFFLLVFNKL